MMPELLPFSPDSVEPHAAKAERDKIPAPSPSGAGNLLPVTRIQRGNVIVRTVFGEGPPCPICGRVLAPFSRGFCKPFKP
jgi:hypothetical protein